MTWWLESVTRTTDNRSAADVLRWLDAVSSLRRGSAEVNGRNRPREAVEWGLADSRPVNGAYMAAPTHRPTTAGDHARGLGSGVGNPASEDASHVCSFDYQDDGSYDCDRCRVRRRAEAVPGVTDTVRDPHREGSRAASAAPSQEERR